MAEHQERHEGDKPQEEEKELPHVEVSNSLPFGAVGWKAFREKASQADRLQDQTENGEGRQWTKKEEKRQKQNEAEPQK